MDDFVEAALGVEECLKAGSFATALTSMAGAKEKKKEHVNFVSGQSSKPKAVYLGGKQSSPQQHAHDTAPRTPRKFSELKYSLSILLPVLLEKKMVTLRKPLPPSDSKWYHANEHCDFHQGPGHTTDNCMALRHVIQNLIEEGKITGIQETPNIISNPFPDHQANYIETEEFKAPIKRVKRATQAGGIQSSAQTFSKQGATADYSDNPSGASPV